MTHTGYDFTQPHLAGMATGYSAWQTKVDDTGITLEFGADGLYSTIEDLYRWDQALFMHTQTLVSRQTLDEMFTNAIALCPTAQAPTCSPSSVFAAYHRPLEAPTYASLLAIRYGYGWFITTVEGSKSPIIYHGGLTFGFTTYNAFYPDSNTIIIVLGNLETANSVNLTQVLHAMVTVAT